MSLKPLAGYSVRSVLRRQKGSSLPPGRGAVASSVERGWQPPLLSLTARPRVVESFVHDPYHSERGDPGTQGPDLREAPTARHFFSLLQG